MVAAFTFVTLYFVNLFPPPPGGEFAQSPNEFSRFDLVVSMAEHRSFSIDRELVEFGNHEDKSVFNGRYFSNKAPGLSFASLPVYPVWRGLAGPRGRDRSQWLFYFLRLSTVSTSVIVALVFLSRRLETTSRDPRVVPLIVFAVAFGSPLLVYARSFFSHAWTASLLYIAFELISRETSRGRNALVAGFLAGWAVLSEYPAAIVAGILLADCFWRRPRSRGWLFAAGAVPCALLLAFYDWKCFGGVLELSSRHEAFRGYTELSRRPLLGFESPSPRIAFGYLFSVSRGLLIQCPVFLLLPIAAVSRALPRRARNVSLAAVGVFFVAMCGYENWHGGWSLSSRYLLPVLFLAAWTLPAALPPAPKNLSTGLVAVAASYSAIYFFFSGATFWFLPPEPQNSLRFYSAFWLSRGWTTPTLLGTGWATLVVPAAVTLAALLVSVRAATGEWGKTLLAVSAGALLFALYFLGAPPTGTFGDRLARARIFESSSGLDPDRIEIKRLGAEARTPAEYRSWARALSGYGLEPAVPLPAGR